VSEPAEDDEDDPADESEEDEEESEDDFESELESDDELDELEDPLSVGSAQAAPGVVTTATPTPKATAKPPTRPMYLA
jgi:hypothetical protein